ncbi:hypothetical protein QMK17_06880 [Rhodococcus sp. G-MC3]|uniref:hypothetical protein n=1 Tax=Rhodococcus sp. G-MC3 TaxID=3046209 RepID=UPI0024B99B38|nr:hypothetical protein [Rhodococcus sp. G-MC3]MDJ0393052.1 hypothetical protein [Rhodococcus sp. G-MC3]
MIVDCGDCKVRDIACADCVVTVLLGAPSMPSAEGVRVGSWAPKLDIDQEELGAIDILAAGGLVPRLRLVVDAKDTVERESLSSRDTETDQRAV